MCYRSNRTPLFQNVCLCRGLFAKNFDTKKTLQPKYVRKILLILINKMDNIHDNFHQAKGVPEINIAVRTIYSTRHTFNGSQTHSLQASYYNEILISSSMARSSKLLILRLSQGFKSFSYFSSSFYIGLHYVIYLSPFFSLFSIFCSKFIYLEHVLNICRNISCSVTIRVRLHAMNGLVDVRIIL